MCVCVCIIYYIHRYICWFRSSFDGQQNLQVGRRHGLCLREGRCGNGQCCTTAWERSASAPLWIAERNPSNLCPIEAEQSERKNENWQHKPSRRSASQLLPNLKMRLGPSAASWSRRKGTQQTVQIGEVVSKRCAKFCKSFSVATIYSLSAQQGEMICQS